MARASLESQIPRPQVRSFTEIGAPNKARANSLRILEEEERKFQPDIYWYLSFRCNLACAHCSVQSSPWVDTTDDLDTEGCLRVVDQMAELNVRTAMMTGGEVLLRPDAVQIMEALAQRGIRIGLETNGLRFDKAFVKLAQQLQSRGLLNITISLDGGTKETHERLRGPRSFDRTVRGFHFLKDNGVRFHIQCVLNGENYTTIPDLYDLARRLSPECVMVQWALLNPIGRGEGLTQEIGLKPEHIEPIFKSITEEKKSFAGQTLVKVPPVMVPPAYLGSIFKDSKTATTMTCQFPLLGVLPNGDVSICAVSRNDDSLAFGNIRDIRLKDIWQKTRMDMLRGRYVAAQDLEGICGDCVWKFSCKGACRAWAYEEGQNFDAPFPICQALDEAGAFPKVYKLSQQNAVAAKRFQEMNLGCSCG